MYAYVVKKDRAYGVTHQSVGIFVTVRCGRRTKTGYETEQTYVEKQKICETSFSSQKIQFNYKAIKCSLLSLILLLYNLQVLSRGKARIKKGMGKLCVHVTEGILFWVVRRRGLMMKIKEI